jgi:hypothetical protein
MDRDDADEAVVRAAREGGGDDELAAQLHELRRDLTAPASSQTRWNHLAAMRRAAADPTVEVPVDPTAELPLEETVAARTRTWGPGRRRAAVLVAAATVGVVGLTGGLAAAGRLPPPAQDRVADLAKVVGIHLPDHDDARDVGPGNGREIIRPTTTRAGASGTAPPVGPRGPGATGTLPGSSGSAPGHAPTGPGSSELAPGHTKDPGTPADGGSGTPPGQSGGDHGSSGTPPGTTGSHGNGNPGSPPGHTGPTGPTGNNGKAPGRDGSNGKSEIAPGHTKGTTGSSPVQGTDQ